jgi:phenylpyruvate tautomerase PptA (4-oxalocrotonate tautomerase family)
MPVEDVSTVRAREDAEERARLEEVLSDQFLTTVDTIGELKARSIEEIPEDEWDAAMAEDVEDGDAA